MRNRRGGTIKDVLVASISSCLFVALAIVICLLFSDVEHPVGGSVNVDSICLSCATCHAGMVETTVRDGWIPERTKNYER